jgi:mannose-1-phosphate guanylyltransferase/phosphomannomutase
MKAVIIAGGLGTRLRPLTYNLPKPIVPLANRPFVVHQIEHLIKHGVDEIILNLHYLSSEIKKVLDDGKAWGIKIHYSLEESPLGTAGAVKNAEKYFDKGPMIIFNGDILTDINITKVVNYHREKQALVTLTLTEVDDPTPFGLVLTDKEGRVTKFIEKPAWEMVTARTINAGIYVVNPEIFNEVPRDKEYSFERQLYPSLLERGAPIFGYLSDAYWIDIGNPQKYKEAHEAILRGEVAVKIFGTRTDGKTWIGKECHLDASVRLVGPALIGEKGKIEKGATLKDYVILGDRVTVGSQTILSHTIILEGTRIGSHANLAGCIIGRNCIIEDEVVIEGPLVLADGSTIKKGTRLC